MIVDRGAEFIDFGLFVDDWPCGQWL
jgi:hypothetical protein